MVVAKGTSLERAARFFHALSDETRLRIIHELREGEQCVCVLTERLQVGQSRLSFHLKTLKEAGLITDRPEGRWIYYALDETALEDLKEILRDVAERRPWRKASSRCCE